MILLTLGSHSNDYGITFIEMSFNKYNWMLLFDYYL